MDKDTIILGSGDVYVKDHADTLPSIEEMITADNHLGYISGGATLEYKPSFYEAKDDKGKVSKTIITEEEATFKTGILTFNGKTLDKLCDTARVEETDGKRIVKIGGTGNRKGKFYVILFHYSDPTDGAVDVMIVGQNQAGFSLAFAKDKETVIDAEFKAKPMDEEGTLITYTETAPATAEPANTDPEVEG